MSNYIIPGLFALFVWWFSTGAIIFLDGLPRTTFKWSMLGASAVFAICVIGLVKVSGETTVAAAYWAFGFGLFAWGWQEISFYMGFVTGPRIAPCPENCRGWAHFGHAIQTSLWHELAIIGSAILIVALTWGQPNQVGVWTFMVLWWMHQSAKLNVFLGVRNLNEEFLPEHMNFLKSFLKRKPMNLLFPFSITISTVIGTIMFEHAASATTGFARAGDTFIGVMMALAILEHWFLVVPLPAAKIWGWGLKSRKPTKAFDVEIIAGFLGAGKTTFMRRRLDMLGAVPPESREKTVVLVNDFSTVGIDGSLLRGQGADVVELPNGCICCSLKNDLASQLEDVVGKFAPDRVLIEPSGVADLASLIGVLERPAIVPFKRSLTVITMIDASAFLGDYAEMQAHFSAQARLASLLIVNKTDLVSAAERDTVEETLQRLNPDVRIITARYGAVPADAFALSSKTRKDPTAADDERDAAPRISTQRHESEYQPKPSVPLQAQATPRAAPAPVVAPEAHDDHAHTHHDHAEHHHTGCTDSACTDPDHHHDHDHAHQDALGFASWAGTLDTICDADALRRVLDAAVAGDFGTIARLKGLARSGRGWVQFDIAGHRASICAFAAPADEQPRVVAIGRNLDDAGLAAAFAGCSMRLAAE
ncbi:putative photosynthetic complex assembly protein PuhE [Acidiphilium sp.]|uniref:putative photosynthetic complex assembly protein PuhE n=1 Tax=Acidiphilium sp. TaxID=527 RepID=UPI003CFF9608